MNAGQADQLQEADYVFALPPEAGTGEQAPSVHPRELAGVRRSSCQVLLASISRRHIQVAMRSIPVVRW
jgi:hypothetical protein